MIIRSQFILLLLCCFFIVVSIIYMSSFIYYCYSLMYFNEVSCTITRVTPNYSSLSVDVALLVLASDSSSCLDSVYSFRVSSASYYLHCNGNNSQCISSIILEYSLYNNSKQRCFIDPSYNFYPHQCRGIPSNSIVLITLYLIENIEHFKLIIELFIALSIVVILVCLIIIISISIKESREGFCIKDIRVSNNSKIGRLIKYARCSSYCCCCLCCCDNESHTFD